MNNNFDLSKIDLSKYIDGFSINIDNREININSRYVAKAIDSLSFRALPIYNLPYIPATISPCEACQEEGYLEHPYTAFKQYKKMGASKLIMELKHMGSNSVIYVYKDKEAALKFSGQCKTVLIHTRAGNQFFKEENEVYISNTIKEYFDKVDFFNKNNTSFVVFGAEILPWNLKALLYKEFLPTLDACKSLYLKLSENLDSEIDSSELLSRVQLTNKNIESFKEQLENYCWDIDISKIKIAPFHILAIENQTFFDKEHEWHLNYLDELYDIEDSMFIRTPYLIIDLNDIESQKQGLDFWLHYTKLGFEGAMIKTEKYLEYNSDGNLILPMMKVRGKEYLRLIYGVNYDSEEFLYRLKNRDTSKKRGLHYKQTLLGIKAMESFSRGEPLENWHDFAFANICLGNVSTDPRL